MTAGWLPPEVWEAAADDSLSAGEARIGDRIVEFSAACGFELTPWQQRIAAAVFSDPRPLRPRLPMRNGYLLRDALIKFCEAEEKRAAAEGAYRRTVASACHSADRCVMDAGCPFVADCLIAEVE